MDTAVSILTKLRSLCSDRGKRFFLPPKCPNWFWGPVHYVPDCFSQR